MTSDITNHLVWRKNHRPITFLLFICRIKKVICVVTALTIAPAEQEAPTRLARIQSQDSGPATIGATSQYAERPPDFGEYVDFGAHTGDHGAFGWYADYPINNRDNSGY